MQLTIKRKMVEVSNLAEASATYDAARASSAQGMRSFPDGQIWDDDGELIARISFNAKVWPAAPWFPGQVPLYSPYSAGAL